MPPSDTQYYRAFAQKDKHYDGVFFVGVTSTGIYCRPICTARLPKESNCRFFADIKTAEKEGFRACKRCRPELAPGAAPVDDKKRIAELFKQRLENGTIGFEQSIEDMARHFELSARQFRRIIVMELGVTPLHRLSFAPLAKYREAPMSATPPRTTRLSATTKVIGDRAENVVAEYLETQGHVILARNWKTKICEIDIVSQFGDIIYFTEVKYRKNNRQGGGIAAITPKKLRQMKFAAEYYALKHKLDQTNMFLAGADVIGEDFRLREWVIEK